MTNFWSGGRKAYENGLREKRAQLEHELGTVENDDQQLALQQQLKRIQTELDECRSPRGRLLF